MDRRFLLLEGYRYHIIIAFWTVILLLVSWKNFGEYSFLSVLLSFFVLILYFGCALFFVHMFDLLWARGMMKWVPALIMLLFPVISLIAYGWLYILMPRCGFYVQKPGVRFDLTQYLSMIITEYGKLIIWYTLPMWLFLTVLRLIAGWKSFQHGFGLLNSQLKCSKMSLHLERNTLSFILHVARVGRAGHVSVLLEMYLDIKGYIADVAGLSLPLKPIRTEMRYVRKMAQFYSLRFGQEDAFRIEIKGRYSGQTVPALVLLTIMENVGTYADLKQPDAVSIDLILRDEGYTFRCRNIKKDYDERITEPTHRGLQFVREQMDSHFLGAYEMSIVDTDRTYQLELKANI